MLRDHPTRDDQRTSSYHGQCLRFEAGQPNGHTHRHRHTQTHTYNQNNQSQITDRPTVRHSHRHTVIESESHTSSKRKEADKARQVQSCCIPRGTTCHTPSARTNAKLEALAMDVVRERRHAVRERHRVGHQPAIHIASNGPAIVCNTTRGSIDPWVAPSPRSTTPQRRNIWRSTTSRRRTTAKAHRC